MWQREQKASSSEPGRETVYLPVPMSNVEAHSPLLAKGLCAALAVPSGGSGVSHSPCAEVALRKRKKGGAPDRIAPGVRHHRTVPFVEDLLVAGLALPRAVFLLPVLLVGRRKCLRLSKHVGRGLRKTVGNVVQLALVRLVVNQGAGGQRGGQERCQFQGFPFPLIIALLHEVCVWAVSHDGMPCNRSYARIGSLHGTSGALPRLRMNIRKRSADISRGDRNLSEADSWGFPDRWHDQQIKVQPVATQSNSMAIGLSTLVVHFARTDSNTRKGTTQFTSRLSANR